MGNHSMGANGSRNVSKQFTDCLMSSMSACERETSKEKWHITDKVTYKLPSLLNVSISILKIHDLRWGSFRLSDIPAGTKEQVLLFIEPNVNFHILSRSQRNDHTLCRRFLESVQQACQWRKKLTREQSFPMNFLKLLTSWDYPAVHLSK